MKKFIAVALAATFVLTGCNTVKGFGKDVSKVGDGISKTSSTVSKKL